jgi:hypothetical protein
MTVVHGFRLTEGPESSGQGRGGGRSVDRLRDHHLLIGATMGSIEYMKNSQAASNLMGRVDERTIDHEPRPAGFAAVDPANHFKALKEYHDAIQWLATEAEINRLGWSDLEIIRTVARKLAIQSRSIAIMHSEIEAGAAEAARLRERHDIELAEARREADAYLAAGAESYLAAAGEDVGPDEANEAVNRIVALFDRGDFAGDYANFKTCRDAVKRLRDNTGQTSA